MKGLEYVKLRFLPLNTTSMTQSTDHGVTHNFKMQYRKLVCQRQISERDNSELLEAIKVVGTLRVNEQAWQSVTPALITNSNCHAGF